MKTTQNATWQSCSQKITHDIPYITVLRREIYIDMSGESKWTLTEMHPYRGAFLDFRPAEM